jgi:hypothetical protein
VTAVIPEGLEPAAVWDVRGDRGPWLRRAVPETPEAARMIEAAQWVCRNITPAANVYRVDFYALDAPFAVVHRFEAEGPVVVLLDGLPPAHLLRCPLGGTMGS